jgi:hypothetical protein
MSKQTFCCVALLAFLALPTSSQAAAPDLQTLTQQLQTLSAQVESLKLRTSSSTPRVKNASSTVDRTCMATAVAAREDSIATAWSAFSKMQVDTHANRKLKLIEAWNMTDAKARNQALTATWKTSRSNMQSAREQLNKTRTGAWEIFKSTAKSSCKTELPKEDSQGPKDSSEI